MRDVKGRGRRGDGIEGGRGGRGEGGDGIEGGRKERVGRKSRECVNKGETDRQRQRQRERFASHAS